MQLKIDVSDWEEEFEHEGKPLETDEDVLAAAVRDGRSPAQLARFAIVGREKGKGPKDLIKPNKLLLQSGARTEITNIICRQRTNGTLPGGQEVLIRQAYSTHGMESESARSMRPYALPGSKARAEVARHWLENVLPGHVRPRLVELALAGENPLEVAAEVSNMVFAIAHELQDEETERAKVA